MFSYLLRRYSFLFYRGKIAIFSSIDENIDNFNKIFEYRRKLQNTLKTRNKHASIQKTHGSSISISLRTVMRITVQ